MSTTIDSKVVEMRFDNQQFESGARTTMSTLERLKQSLNLTGASKGLENVNAAAKNFNMSGMGNAIETVRTKFSALEVMGVTALANITNSAVNCGKKMMSALTIDPIKTGFQEYETQIGAVQTILANTQHEGTNLQQVNRALDELNTYADKTIYNFTEMTRNIGTFTAAGVDLQTSVDSIKGIANLAAVSGSTSQQASTAMYQLSQALAAGKVTLMDWNSVVNAGMGGKVFQDALLRTSELLKTGGKEAVKTYGSFRESLTQGEWLTTEVLTETLKQFSGAYSEADLVAQGFTKSQAKEIAKMAETATDAATKVKTVTQLWDTLKESAQSGWTNTWEILIGDFGEAKETLTEVSDKIGSMIQATADARNKLLGEGLSSGWKQLLSQGIDDEAGFIDSIEEVARKSGDSFDKIVADSDDFSDALKKGLKEGVISSDTLSDAVFNLQKKMSGMSAEELKAAGYSSEMVKNIETLSAGLKDGSISMDEFTEKMMKPSGRENIIQALWNTFEGILSVITPVKEAFREIFPPATGEQLYALTEKLRDFTEKLKLSSKNAENVKRIFKGLFSILDIGVEAVKAVAKGILTLIGSASGLGTEFLDSAASIGDFLTGMRDSIKETNIFGKAVDKLVSFLQKGIGKFKELVGFLKEKIQIPGWEGFLDIMQTVWDVIQKIGQKVSDVGSKIGEAISTAFRNGDISSGLDVLNGGILAAVLINIKKFVGNINGAFGDGGFLDNVKGVLDDVRGCLEAWQQNIKANTLLKIAGAIAILAASLVVLSMINPDRLAGSLGAITVMFAELMGSMAILSKINGFDKGTEKAMIAMIGMSTAVLILASALKKISSINPEQLSVGLIGITVLLAELVAISIIMSKTESKMVKGSIGLILLATSLKILASVCKDFSSMSWEELGKGLLGITVVLGELTAVSVILSKTGTKMMKGSAGLIIMAAAMKVLASACKDFSSMSWEELGKGVASIGGILLVFTGFSALLKLIDPKKLLTASTSLVIVGAAMEIFADVCSKFGQMKWEELGKAGAAIAGILVLAAGFSLLAGFSSGMLAAVISLTIMGAAMEIFADVCAKFGQMDWGALAKAGAAVGGILVLATAFGIIAGFAPGMITSSAALLIMAGALSILTPVLQSLGGMSWEEIGKGLLTIAGAFTIIGVAGALLMPVVPSILALGGAIALIGVGALACGAGLSLIAAGFTALATAGTAGATAVVAALTIIITGVINLIPTIIQKIGEGIVLFCGAITAGIPAIGEAITAIILTILNVINDCAPQIINTVLLLLTQLLQSIADYTPQIVQAGFDILMGLLNGMRDNIGQVVSVATDIIIELINALAENTMKMAQAGVDLIINLINGMADGIRQNAPRIRDAMLNLCEAMLEAVLVFFGIHSPSTVFANIGKNIVEGLRNGIKGLASAPVKALKSIAGDMLDSISSKVKSFKTKGSDLMSNLKTGITAKKADVKSSVKSTVTNAISAISEKYSNFKSKGSDLMTKLKAGISSKKSEIKSTVKDTVSDAISGIKGKISDFRSVGKDLISGLKNGIKDKAKEAVNAAKGIAKDAIQAAKNLLGINSPSKVFAEIGRYVDEGFVVGLNKYASRVTSSAKAVGASAINAVSNAVDNVDDLIGINTQPTIRPVLDLSAVQDKASAINGLFNSSTVGVSAQLNAVGASIRQRNQNGGTDDIVSAINKLGKNLNNVGGTSYTIGDITYDDGSGIANAVESIVRAARIERRM